MPQTSSEDNIIASVIRDLVKRVEDYESIAQTRENEFKEYLMAQFVALRKDIFDSYLDIKLKYDDHTHRHNIDEQRIENDRLQRAQRQFTLNLLLGALALLVILGFVVVITVILLRR